MKTNRAMSATHVYHVRVWLVIAIVTLATTVTEGKRKEIIVIGGGMAGVAAARTIRNNRQGDFHVTVFEARRDRYGGRVWSNKKDLPLGKGVMTDLGASALNSDASNNPLFNLSEKFELKTQKLTPLHVYHHKHGKWLSGSELVDAFVETRKILMEAMMRTKPLSYDMSVRQAVSDVVSSLTDSDGDNLVVQILEMMITYNIPDFSAALYQPDMMDFGFNTVLLDGMGELVDRLVSGADAEVELMVELRKVVRHIEIDTVNKEVVVRLRDGTQTRADAVVVALPAAVLREELVLFDPPLPGKYRDALKQLGTSNTNRLIVEFDQLFWPPDVGVFKAKTDHKQWSTHTWINMYKLTGQPILVTSVGGPTSSLFENSTDAEIEPFIRDRLKIMFGTAAETTKIVKILKSKWNSALHSGMASSYPKVGTDPKIWDILSEPLCPYIYFAGEHTTYKGLGTVHGAYNSGVKAAEQLVSGLCEERQKEQERKLAKKKAKKAKKETKEEDKKEMGKEDKKEIGKDEL